METREQLGLPPQADAQDQNEVLRPVFKYWTSIAEMGIIKFFLENKVFDAIPEQGGVSTKDLAQATGVDESLLERFANFLVSVGILSAPASGQVALTKLSSVYRGGNSRGAMIFLHGFDFFLTPVAHWPKYFEGHGLSEPKKANQAPICSALGHPDKNFYELLETMPERAKLFNQTMTAASAGMPITGMYDFKWIGEYARADASTRPLFVDVGGGKGQAIKAILQEMPQIPASRCVLIDQPDVVAEAKREDDETLRPVNKVGKSFFEKNPIQGALVYHIRRVLNDWPDDDVETILGNVRAVCAADSRILVSEQLLLSPPTPFNALLDIFVLNLAGKRRDERMYGEIATKVGLKVTGVFPDQNKSDSAIIEMVPV